MTWFQLTMIFAVTGSSLILSMRAITHDTNPFIFMTIVMALASMMLFGYCIVANIPLNLSPPALRLAALAGGSVAILDLAFIFMFRKHAPVSVAMPIFRVAAIMISAIVGCALFHEELAPIRVAGIVLACLAVYLLNSKPKQVVEL